MVLSIHDSLLLRMAGFVTGTILAIAVHETGHFVCALAGAIGIRVVSIGQWPLLLRRRIGETWLEIRLLPLGGYVATYPEALVRKFPLALFYCGGVLANLMTLVIVGLLGSAGALPAWLLKWGDLIAPMLLMQAICIINLLPNSAVATFAGGRIGSDGFQLLQLWRLRNGAPTVIGLAYAQAMERHGINARSGSNPRLASRMMYHVFKDRWTTAAARRESDESIIRELARGGASTVEEVMMLDLLVTDGLMSADPWLRPRLDAWSERALALAPDAKTLKGSRGSVLVQLGRVLEGQAILEGLVTDPELRPFDRFMCEIGLAQAALLLGDPTKAECWASAAADHWAAAGADDVGAARAAADMIARVTARSDQVAGLG